LAVFLAVDRSLVACLDGASVVIDRIPRIIAPTIVQERAWRMPAIVRMMLARFPSSRTGLEAKE